MPAGYSLHSSSRLRYKVRHFAKEINARSGLTFRLKGYHSFEVHRLSDGMFIETGENVLITGATGCGKSLLACALGRSSCLLGYRRQYFSMSKTLEALAQGRLNSSYLKWIKDISPN
jgi:DNA replication protein DnaC